MKSIKGFGSLLLAGFIFGTFGIWIRILNKELTTYQQIFFRGMVGFILATLLVFLLKQTVSLNKVNKKTLLAYAFCFPFSIIFFVVSLLHTKIAVTVFAFYATSILSSLFIGILFFKEKLTQVKIVSLFFVIVGIFFLSYPLQLSSLSFGLVIGLIGGFFDASANSLRKFVSGKIDRFVLVGIQMLGVMIIALFFLFLNKQSVVPLMSVPTLITGIIFGGFLMSISFLTLVGFQNYDLNLGTIVLSSELIFAPIFAAIAFREFPNTMEIIGGIFIASAIVVSNLNFGKRKN